MALKPDRTIVVDDISYFAYSTAERGGVMVSTTGTPQPVGAAMDSTRRRVEYATLSSGRKPIGLLLHDVVNIDQSRQMLNPYKTECQIGSKVPLAVRGTYVTNMIGAAQASGLAMPVPAYLGPNGQLFTAAGYAGSGYPIVGRFLTNTDTDGYAQLEVNIPNS